MLQSLLNSTLDRAVSRAVRDSSRARELCARLDGRTVCIEITGSPWRVQLEGRTQQLQARLLLADSTEPADARIQGSAVTLLGALGEAQRGLLQNGSLRIEGDAEVAQACSELLQALRPDIEEVLGRRVGPVGAHLLWRGARAAWTQGSTLLRDQSRNAADWLAHERRALVPAPEAEHRYRQIEAAREQLDRLEARVQALEARP